MALEFSPNFEIFYCPTQFSIAEKVYPTKFTTLNPINE